MKKIVALTIAATLVLTGQVVYATPAVHSVNSTNLVEKLAPPPGAKYVEHYLWWKTENWHKYYRVYIKEVGTEREIAYQKIYPDRNNTRFNINNSLLVEGKSYRISVTAYDRDDGTISSPVARGEYTYKVNKLYTYRDHEDVQINIYLNSTGL